RAARSAESRSPASTGRRRLSSSRRPTATRRLPRRCEHRPRTSRVLAATARPSKTRSPRSRPRSAPRPRSAYSNQPHWYEQATSFRMRIGVVTEAFGERPLDSVLDWLTEAVPTVKDLELASGGYAPTPHCDREGLLRDAA